MPRQFSSVLHCSSSGPQRVQGDGEGAQPGPRGAQGLCRGDRQGCLAAGGCGMPGCFPADSRVEMLGSSVSARRGVSCRAL